MANGTRALADLNNAVRNYNAVPEHYFFAPNQVSSVTYPGYSLFGHNIPSKTYQTYNSNGFVNGLLRALPSGESSWSIAAAAIQNAISGFGSNGGLSGVPSLFAAPGYSKPVPAGDFKPGRLFDTALQLAEQYVTSTIEKPINDKVNALLAKPFDQLTNEEKAIVYTADGLKIVNGLQDIASGGVANVAIGTTKIAAVLVSDKALALKLTAAGGAIGGVLGIVQGYQTGGVVGGVEAGAATASLIKALGVLFKNPAWISSPTAIAIEIVVGAIALAFGGNHDDPATQPDKYDTGRYGQIIADLQGHAGANGSDFSESASTAGILDNRTGIAAIEETLAQYGSADNAPSWLKSSFDTLKAQFGVDATGSGKLYFGSHINDERIYAPGTDGRTYQYTDFGTSLYAFLNAYATRDTIIAVVPPSSELPTNTVYASVAAEPTVQQAIALPQFPGFVDPALGNPYGWQLGGTDADPQFQRIDPSDSNYSIKFDSQSGVYSFANNALGQSSSGSSVRIAENGFRTQYGLSFADDTTPISDQYLGDPRTWSDSGDGFRRIADPSYPGFFVAYDTTTQSYRYENPSTGHKTVEYDTASQSAIAFDAAFPSERNPPPVTPPPVTPPPVTPPSNPAPVIDPLYGDPLQWTDLGNGYTSIEDPGASGFTVSYQISSGFYTYSSDLISGRQGEAALTVSAAITNYNTQYPPVVHDPTPPDPVHAPPVIA